MVKSVSGRDITATQVLTRVPRAPEGLSPAQRSATMAKAPGEPRRTCPRPILALSSMTLIHDCLKFCRPSTADDTSALRVRGSDEVSPSEAVSVRADCINSGPNPSREFAAEEEGMAFSENLREVVVAQ